MRHGFLGHAGTHVGVFIRVGLVTHVRRNGLLRCWRCCLALVTSCISARCLMREGGRFGDGVVHEVTFLRAILKQKGALYWRFPLFFFAHSALESSCLYIYIYIMYTPNLGFGIAVPGQEREQGRFKGSTEGAPRGAA